MVQIVIIAHAEIAHSFHSCVKYILSTDVINNLHVIGIERNEKLDKVFGLAVRLIDKLALTDSVLILSDIFGATPSNLAQNLLQRHKVELITGLNLSMLIRAISYSRTSDLATCAKKVLDGGKNAVMLIEAKSDD